MYFLCLTTVAVLVFYQETEAEGFGYRGAKGPSHWGEHYPSCDGKKQSPINIEVAKTEASNLGAVNIDNLKGLPKGLELENNGHAAQVNVDADDYIVNGGGLEGDYKVLQFHFHFGKDDDKGSEHTINGGRFPMEMHVVTYKTEYDSLADGLDDPSGVGVLSFLFEIGKEDNSAFDPIIEGLSKVVKAGKKTAIDPFPIADLVAGINMSAYYRYDGSLTTPGCNEAVVWTIFKDKIKISEKQMDAYRKLKNERRKKLFNNFRPIQDLNGRVVQQN